MRVDHDAVGISVDHLETKLVLRQVDRALEALSPLSRHQGRDRLGVETAVVWRMSKTRNRTAKKERKKTMSCMYKEMVMKARARQSC